MRRIDHRLMFVAFYAFAALLLSLRVPMILSGEDWRDVWLWSAYSKLGEDRQGRLVNLNSYNAVIALSSADVELDPTQKPQQAARVALDPVRRWDVFARRQVILLLVGLTIYLAAFPLRKRLLGVLLWFDNNPRIGILTLYLFVAAWLMLEPPCIQVFTSYHYLREQQQLFTVYLPLWDRRASRIDYGALLTEQLTLVALTGATYLSYCAFRGKRPW